jgi:hypothetical protein
MNPYQNPSIEIFGLRVDEPVTTGTDIIVSLIAIFGYCRIASSPMSKHVKLYAYFFLGTGICTLIAGLTGHAFLYRFDSVVGGKMIGWAIGIIGTCLAPFAALYHTRKWLGEKVFKVLLILCYMEIVIAEIILFIHPHFLVVVSHSTFGMLFILTTLEWMNYRRTGSKLSLNLLYGILNCVIAVMFNLTKFSFSRWCNYLDLSHIFMGLSLYFMIKGVLIEQKNNSEYDNTSPAAQ